jgi:hypothetical protein
MPESFFRDAPWLHAARARGWCICLALFSAIGLIASLATAPHGIKPGGTLLSPDFATFYGAADFIARGHAAQAYNHPAFLARLQALFPHATPGDYAFLYPPPFLFLCAGLTALPYMAALVLWLGATWLALLVSLRRLMPPGMGLLVALTYPAMLINAGNGQNAFATGACFAAAMACGDRAPALAGACLGLLAIKPQLALLIPVGLALCGRWRSFAAAGASAIAVSALSAAIFGADTWPAWGAASTLSRTILEKGWNGYQNMLSPFAAIRLLHSGVPLAYAAQAAAAALTLAILVRAINRRTSLPGAIAATAAATLIATPWSLDYDLVILAGPLAWTAAQAVRTGWLPWEKLTLLAAYLLPLLARNISADTRICIAPAILLALLLVIARRTASPQSPASATDAEPRRVATATPV